MKCHPIDNNTKHLCVTYPFASVVGRAKCFVLSPCYVPQCNFHCCRTVRLTSQLTDHRLTEAFRNKDDNAKHLSHPFASVVGRAKCFVLSPCYVPQCNFHCCRTVRLTSQLTDHRLTEAFRNKDDNAKHLSHPFASVVGRAKCFVLSPCYVPQCNFHCCRTVRLTSQLTDHRLTEAFRNKDLQRP